MFYQILFSPQVNRCGIIIYNRLRKITSQACIEIITPFILKNRWKGSIEILIPFLRRSNGQVSIEIIIPFILKNR